MIGLGSDKNIDIKKMTPPVEQEDHIGPASHTIKQLVADLFVERTLKIVIIVMVPLMMMIAIIIMA